MDCDVVIKQEPSNDAWPRPASDQTTVRRPRVVSAACFRVLSLQLEPQNQVDVLKPLLEELEVLRLSCVLGALPGVDATDLAVDLLEPKDVDDDVARFLRADVFSEEAEETRERPRVRVVGLVGKQPQVKCQLTSLGGWDDAMEATLAVDELGLYAVVLPSTDNVKTVAVFVWLLDEYFQPDRLRETPTYLLRLLTCLTSHVTCCFSSEDKILLEHFNTRGDAMAYGSDDEWRSYSAAFHVEQQQDAKDDVSTTQVQLLPLPALCYKCKLDVIKGSSLALMAIAKSPPSKEKRASKKKVFATTDGFCDWLLEQSERFDLRVVVSGATYELAETILRRYDEWPDDELEAIRVTYEMRERLTESQIQKSNSENTEQILAELRAAGDDFFRVDTLLNSRSVESALSAILPHVRALESCEASTLTNEMKRTMRLPERLPRMMKRFEELFENRHEQQLSEALERAPFTLVREMEHGPAKRTFAGTLKSFWWCVVGDSSEVSEAFRQRMRKPLQRMKSIWWAEVSSKYKAYAKARVAELFQGQVAKLRSARSTDSRAAVATAFMRMLHTWSESNTHGLSVHIAVQYRGGRPIICAYEEEVHVPTHDRVYLWAYKPSLPQMTDRDLVMMGRMDLNDGEELQGIFTIQSRSAIAVVVRNGRTIVRRLEFLDYRRGGHRQTVMGQIREIARPSVLCDYYNKERLLVLVDPSGKAGVYRFDEKFKSMETIRTLNLALTSLAMPIKDMVLSDGVLYMVDHEGAMQSLNTRNQQTSRKKQIGFPRSCGGYENGARLVRVLDGSILGWIDVNPESTVTKMRFVASEDMRGLPQFNSVSFPFSKSGLAYEAIDDVLLVVDEAHGNMRAIKMMASLKSESYKIRSINGIHSGDAVAESVETDAKAEAQMLSQQWLWTFYHLYEKFPVRGELFRGATGTARGILELSFVCDSEYSDPSDDLDEGCQKLLGLIMEKLLLLNKPLHGLDLARAQISIACDAASRAALMDDYVRVEPQSVATLLRELVTLVPLQICRAEFNCLTLMSDGQYKGHEETSTVDDKSSLSSADIALKLRFGLLSPLLSSWSRQCIVITSMGKQSTGKSYFLNHLTGSSFAISGARCTDGAWMSVRFLPNGVMLVVMDFEGLGSFERTEQEDVFLSVVNASVSMLTIFRMEMRLDKEIDELFSKFQKGSQLIKNDPRLFRGKLYMSVKDVNPNDQCSVVSEFVGKFQRLLEANKEQNFLTDMYAGQLDINCSPPLGTVGYYRSLSHAQRFIDKQLCGNPKAGFESGKAFLDCIRLLLAKVSILDWTSLDESTLRMRIAEVMKKLPSVLRFGAICDGYTDDATKSSLSVPREKLAVAFTGQLIDVSFDEICTSNPTLASRWRMLVTSSVRIDQVQDEDVDLGACVNFSGTSRTDAESAAIQALFKKFLGTTVGDQNGQVVTKKLQHGFDSFMTFVIRRRCLRIQKWCRSIFGEQVPELWTTTEQQALGSLQTLFVRCLDACSKCQLGCMKVSMHAASGDHAHDCGTSHACSGLCAYCVDTDDVDVPPRCSKPAGHEGRCECDKGDHTCGKPCVLQHAINCGKVCSKKAEHEKAEEHRCSVGLHKCGEPCAARNCGRLCIVDVEASHTVHKCEVDRCLSRCIMEGCNRSCSSTNHFHGETGVNIALDAVENLDLGSKHSGAFDASDEKPTVHMCDEGHACPDMCGQAGVCHIDVIMKQSSKTFVGARGSFQYTFQEMNGSRKKCARKLAPGQMAHCGAHSCVQSRHTRNGDEEAKISESGDRVIHYCAVRCPCCSYYCHREHGHSGLHKTTHGNMRNTMFMSDENEIDLIDRKYTAGERGMAEMCNLYCSKMGRGHVHFLDCDKDSAAGPCVYQGSQEDKRRHCTLKLEPTPEREQDEVLHERFWDTLGWEDPCASIQERDEFAKCAYRCDAPDHDEKEASYCVLPAWHSPAAEPADGSDGFSYVGGHKFECSHAAAGNCFHHIFVLDASGSMQGSPWQRLNGAYREYVGNRINDGGMLDLVTVITFDSRAHIVWEAQPITTMAEAEAPFLGHGTSFSVALRATNEVLSRIAFETYKPVVVFFSDGYPCKGQEGYDFAKHIADSYAKYGLEAFAVGFGHINLTVLQHIAQRLGGTYTQVLTGDELKTTFHSISASLGTRAALVLTKPFHELICVICQKELASEATAVLPPCQHELHQQCLRRLMENSEDGDTKLCSTCRREIPPVVV